MSWGEDYIEEKAEFVQGTAEVKSGCDLAKISIININGIPQACFTENGIQIWIDNGPEVELYNIHARIVGAGGVDTNEEILKEPLLKANAVNAIIPVDSSIMPVRQVKLTPKIWTGKAVALCGQGAITLEQLRPC